MDTPLRLKAKDKDNPTSKLNFCLVYLAFQQSRLFSFPCFSKNWGKEIELQLNQVIRTACVPIFSIKEDPILSPEKDTGLDKESNRIFQLTRGRHCLIWPRRVHSFYFIRTRFQPESCKPVKNMLRIYPRLGEEQFIFHYSYFSKYNKI